MRLATKASLIVIAILFVLTGVQVYIQNRIVYPGFAQIEQQTAERNLKRCIDGLNREVYHLRLLTTDWSNWDATYHFVEDANQEYLDENMTDESFENSKLNLIYIFNSQQKLVYYRLYNIDNSESQAFSSAVHERILSLQDAFFAEDYVSGLVDAVPAPLALASCSILTSNQEGPSHGRLVMGRLFNDKTLLQLSKQLHTGFNLTPLNQVPVEKWSILKSVLETDKVLDIQSNSKLSMYSTFPELNQRPAFLLEVLQDRQITQAGKNIIGFALIPSLSLLICSLFILLFLLDHYMIKPINRFTGQVKTIRRTRDFHEQVTVPNEPEIGLLAREFNRLMRRLGLYYQKRNIAEEKLREALQMADQANRSKSIFLANMSHEIRTPMNAILGFSDLLAEEDLSESQMEYVNTIRTSGQSLLELINDILDLSKIEAGRLIIEPVECALIEHLNAIADLMVPLARQRSLEFRVNIAKDCPVSIQTDPLRLKQCLINLIGNALKFTRQGHVYVNVYTDRGPDGDFICLGVEDTGIGIPADRQAAIFEAFTQSDASTCRQFGGTGLGLTITKKLVEMMQGQITLQSEPGKGSVFTLRLPEKPVRPEIDSQTPSTLSEKA
jgi:signal transduction histidine kinase